MLCLLGRAVPPAAGGGAGACGWRRWAAAVAAGPGTADEQAVSGVFREGWDGGRAGAAGGLHEGRVAGPSRLAGRVGWGDPPGWPAGLYVLVVLFILSSLQSFRTVPGSLCWDSLKKQTAPQTSPVGKTFPHRELTAAGELCCACWAEQGGGGGKKHSPTGN